MDPTACWGAIRQKIGADLHRTSSPCTAQTLGTVEQNSQLGSINMVQSVPKSKEMKASLILIEMIIFEQALGSYNWGCQGRPKHRYKYKY